MQLTVAGLRYSYGPRELFEDLSFRVGSGEMMALMGPSGAGKSTLLSIIAGAIEPDVGSVHIQGRGERRLVWIVQSTPLLPRRTAVENVCLGPLSEGASPGEARERAIAVMARLGVGDRARTKVFKLSGGERQRVAVARAIASSAGIILADEPTASLDPVSRGDVMAALRLAAEAGAIVLVSTHDPMVAGACDWAMVLAGTGTARGAGARRERC